jgi:hypothetical protein
MNEFRKEVSQKWIYNSQINKTNKDQGPDGQRAKSECKKKSGISSALSRQLNLRLGKI